MSVESRLKTIGTFALSVVVVGAVFLLITILLHSMVWASEKVLPWLLDAGRIAFDICIVIILPLCIFRKTRPWAGVGLYIASYLFGTILFAFACIVVVQIWGYFGLIVGLIIAGVGVVPVAFLATLFHAAWPLLLDLIIGTVLTFGTRALGMYLASRGPTEEEPFLQEA